MAMDYSQRKQYVLQMCEMLRIHAAGYFKNKEVSITVSGQQRNPLCCWNCAGLALCSHRRSQMGISSRVSFLPHSLLSLLKHRTVSVQDLRGSAGDAAEELGTAWNWGSVKTAQAHSFLKQPQQQWENSVTCCCLCHSCKLLSVPYKKPSLSRWAQKCMKASLGAPTELVVFSWNLAIKWVSWVGGCNFRMVKALPWVVYSLSGPLFLHSQPQRWAC